MSFHGADAGRDRDWLKTITATGGAHMKTGGKTIELVDPGRGAENGSGAISEGTFVAGSLAYQGN